MSRKLQFGTTTVQINDYPAILKCCGVEPGGYTSSEKCDGHGVYSTNNQAQDAGARPGTELCDAVIEDYCMHPDNRTKIRCQCFRPPYDPLNPSSSGNEALRCWDKWCQQPDRLKKGKWATETRCPDYISCKAFVELKGNVHVGKVTVARDCKVENMPPGTREIYETIVKNQTQFEVDVDDYRFDDDAPDTGPTGAYAAKSWWATNWWVGPSLLYLVYMAVALR